MTKDCNSVSEPSNLQLLVNQANCTQESLDPFASLGLRAQETKGSVGVHVVLGKLAPCSNNEGKSLKTRRCC